MLALIISRKCRERIFCPRIKGNKAINRWKSLKYSREKWWERSNVLPNIVFLFNPYIFSLSLSLMRARARARTRSLRRWLSDGFIGWFSSLLLVSATRRTISTCRRIVWLCIWQSFKRYVLATARQLNFLNTYVLSNAANSTDFFS